MKTNQLQARGDLPFKYGHMKEYWKWWEEWVRNWHEEFDRQEQDR